MAMKVERTEFAKLYFIDAPADYQVLVTKEENSDEDLFQIQLRTELESYSERITLEYGTEEERDRVFRNFTLEKALDFFQNVRANYSQLPLDHKKEERISS